ncbi:SH3 domain-containing protein [Flammeovirga kamogawensis]|uniref:SH3b domain-containing protein n=1 Tax=Flammeovirga kamogawensis TaxID=373891 RepID=A0ABX8H2H1_9BACT|nr:SH3 domain-containing protein [Flammeovirga kamogawensis]QWG09903.1 hypothetical protein KM029_19675 [Flammeovirga kamogawensis]TRX65407.1 hypothetical protein EO216_23070 [Flammeovirga kamogawensis]
MKFLIYTITIIFFLSCSKDKKNIKSDFKPNHKQLESTEKNITESVEKPFLTTKCNFETYVVYKDSLPLFENPEGKIIKYFRFEDDPEYDFGGGFLFKDSKKGWLQIGNDRFYPELENFWIKSKFIEIGTTNYDNSKIELYSEPNKKSNVSGYIYGESYLNVLKCDCDWVYVENGESKGWLSREKICTNPVTTCN